ncbi:hypothetical protein L249_7367 [Ophiocordyceps polyrhachis-furcata BCC 54312]|uniref:Uncharacterized protein n=2 Tax=Ophiocordyceps polyrhachis-furcata BCC 54312 TaxID=1330021 RepID=A0A367L9S6_9HYPO|nr:hypothetical protein L249_7367 [Ophiocordyceps polyrhachis-furcata BCC 54312]
MIWEGIHAQSPIGIVIAARELGKSDFLSVGHDFSMRKNVGKKWVIQAVDEELTNREGDHVIEKKKRNHVMKVRKADADDSSKYFSRYFKVPTCSTLTYLYTCTCQSDRSDRSDPMTPAMTAMTRPLWPL